MKSTAVSLFPRCVALAVLVLAAISPGRSYAIPLNLNPTFDSGLSDWITAGNVSEDGSQFARISNTSGVGGTLSQSTLVGPGSYTLTFDLFSSIAPAPESSEIGDVFSDIGTGTLFLEDPFVVGGPISPQISISLFDAGKDGVTSDLEVESLGDNWNRYRLNFTTTRLYVGVMFDLFDLDFVDNSFMGVDNVKLEAVVPEPVTSALLGMGIIPLLSRRRLSRQRPADAQQRLAE